MKKQDQIIENDLMGLSIEDLITIGGLAIDRDVQMAKDILDKEEQQNRAEEKLAVHLAKNFVPESLHQYLEYGYHSRRHGGVSGLTQWWNTAIILAIPMMARIMIRFCYYHHDAVTKKAVIYLITDHGDDPIVVMDWKPVFDDMADIGDGWYEGITDVKTFKELSRAIKFASELGDRWDEVTKEVEKRNRARHPWTGEQMDTSELTTSEVAGIMVPEIEALSMAIRGIIREFVGYVENSNGGE